MKLLIMILALFVSVNAMIPARQATAEHLNRQRTEKSLLRRSLRRFQRLREALLYRLIATISTSGLAIFMFLAAFVSWIGPPWPKGPVIEAMSQNDEHPVNPTFEIDNPSAFFPIRLQFSSCVIHQAIAGQMTMLDLNAITNRGGQVISASSKAFLSCNAIQRSDLSFLSLSIELSYKSWIDQEYVFEHDEFIWTDGRWYSGANFS